MHNFLSRLTLARPAGQEFWGLHILGALRDLESVGKVAKTHQTICAVQEYIAKRPWFRRGWFLWQDNRKYHQPTVQNYLTVYSDQCSGIAEAARQSF
jgi:hypothetical protein